ncbi:MAG: endonuclease/exonuclease/phosphatase family protein [Crocinitomicaceae bacterium]|nr:endonuclease/exonuclease/phosphatase family protein [Crocinitomicaceae bacterium]
MRRLFILVVFFFSFSSFSQLDTLKVMAYNLLNFPNEVPSRIDTLKDIVQHVGPDILMVCELQNSSGATNILNNAINVDGVTHYEMATFINGPGTDNEIYYNSNKLTLYEQNEISTVLRNISEYVLYYNSTDLATTGDTVFLYVYVAHLKAGTGWESQRLEEVEAMKDYMATRTNAENIILGGDFNFYSSSGEPAWNEILNGEGILLKDPINSPGDWNSNSGYAPIHTQSTRTTALPDNGATGGMDSRFDFIFLGNDVMNGTNDLTYIDDSYNAIGQDGFHYNKSLLDAPTNVTEPWDIIRKLYYMSDHLPIYLELEVVTQAAGIEEDNPYFDKVFYDSITKSIRFTGEFQIAKNEVFVVFDLNGKEIASSEVIDDKAVIELGELSSGMYVVACKALNLEKKFFVE